MAQHEENDNKPCKQDILEVIRDLASNFLYYDRKRGPTNTPVAGTYTPRLGVVYVPGPLRAKDGSSVTARCSGLGHDLGHLVQGLHLGAVDAQVQARSGRKKNEVH